MIVVGLTGGIGSGKSAVAARLAARGAVVIDADAITRDLQRPGEPVFAAIVERFGPRVVAATGDLDRAVLAEIVFADPDARQELEAIVHPAVGGEMVRRLHAVSDPDAVVVYDVPLLVEAARSGYAAVVVVDLDPEVAVRRLVDHRGMAEADARGRVASQASRQDRLAAADYVVDNSGSLADLDRRVEALWAWLVWLERGGRRPIGER